MRKSILLLILLNSFKICIGGGCNPYDIGFGEITFIQDSINPLKFYFKVATINGTFCSFQRDSCQMQWECPWKGVYGYLPLVDTQFSSRVYPTQIYGGYHTFDSIPADSLIQVSFTAMGRTGGFNDWTPNANFNSPFGISLVLNMAYLRYHTGIKSAYFQSQVIGYGVVGEPLYFDPQIWHEPQDSLKVTLILPKGDCSDDAGITWPTDYQPNSHNILTTYEPTGLLIWNYPPLGDANSIWDITYLVTAYREGTFVYSMMRDMHLQTNANTTGLVDLERNSIVKCYPSPTHGNFTIDVSGVEAGAREIKIINQLGQSVFQTTSWLDKIQVAEKLPIGLYTVTVTSHAFSTNTRIVIE